MRVYIGLVMSMGSISLYFLIAASIGLLIFGTDTHEWPPLFGIITASLLLMAGFIHFLLGVDLVEEADSHD